MVKPLLIIWLLLISISMSLSQPIKVDYQFSFSGISFKTNTSVGYKFTSQEVKIGANLRLPLGRFGIHFGVLPGYRLKQNIDTIGWRISSNWDEVFFVQEMRRSYSPGSFFLEVPITASYSLWVDRLSIQSGLSLRFIKGQREYKFDNTPFDPGIISSIRYNLKNRIGVGFDYFYGLRELNKMAYFNSQQSYYVRSQYLQFSIYLNASKR